MTEQPPSAAGYEFVFDVLWNGEFIDQYVFVGALTVVYPDQSSGEEKANLFVRAYESRLRGFSDIAGSRLESWIKKNDPHGRNRYNLAYKGSKRIF